MKTSFNRTDKAMLGCFLIACLLTISCNREDLDVFNPPTHKLKSVSYYSDNELRHTYNYEYDSKDRISIVITTNALNSDVIRTIYDYQESVLIVNEFRNDTLIGTSTYNLDSRGLIADGKHQFDNEGQQIKYYINNQKNDYLENTWVNGNIISTAYYYNYKLSHIYRYYYDVSKDNSTRTWSVYGKDNQNLVIYYEFIRPGNNPPSKHYYEYQFDNIGRVVKEFLSERSYYAYNYYD